MKPSHDVDFTLISTSSGLAGISHYNHLRCRENIANFTPADIYFGRSQTNLLERERIKRNTIQN